ncbi:FeoB-associated Cys-rich membrane protein [Capnocytophaga canimorsus]|uniref:FeoB-associated Cys-rich membrane protein n=1 Tax=Capnocytophaga canimorsus TaxID=28188 RepID=A0A250G631_9FLAO|nr:FeoB-associated Cys-rich membrane protein [Capnocytophaga canimorsus]ATA76126.1 FeoB-associated Cys-rich membrane protein [Capnocytophaga canimorsus]ATA92675.1 FeoB-associated Cys-rich membrane protein [Capnocytophaga canimorsus]ATA92879.1 FeoB-associated Cys-rich membrane protein [Capnocytophaga canimorsus]AWL77540.1 FeoB-associated Cys-rich membrane protein [Capnocytophaga canimorsus]AYW36092.1 FeoB-associated Cys-rich membrane protein [Capnocytophaga canimorsus]
MQEILTYTLVAFAFFFLIKTFFFKKKKKNKCGETNCNC